MFNIEKYISNIQSSNTIEELDVNCKLLCEDLNIDYYSFALSIPARLNAPLTVAIQNFPEKWEEIYKIKNFIEYDPVLSYSQRFTIPVFWSDLKLIEEVMSVKAEEVMLCAKKHDLVQGVSIPIRSPQGDCGVFSLISKNEDSIDLLKSILPIAQSITIYIYDAVIRISSRQQGSSLSIQSLGITKRQEQCLNWASKGKTAWEIAQILDISERTVIFHLKNISDKLGVSNRQHAIAKAVVLGIIKPEYKVEN
ncbi:MAG: LuxR family transcriptional regulator [Saccharospirillaceae bacterium]|nr:LuxR family transcriptional regulator [Saccharospirillaceae bacterium]